MDNSTEKIGAKQTLRLSPWFAGGSIAVVGFTSWYGLSPISMLLSDTMLGILCFIFTVVSWRRRNGMLRVFSLMLIILGQQVIYHRFGSGHTFEILQGGFTLIAIWSVLMLALRRWIYRFAKLYDPVG